MFFVSVRVRVVLQFACGHDPVGWSKWPLSDPEAYEMTPFHNLISTNANMYRFFFFFIVIVTHLML